jgi:hypothetical protein
MFLKGRKMKSIVLLIMSLLLASCSTEDLLQSLKTSEEAQQAERFLTKLISRNFDSVKSELHPDLLANFTPDNLDKLYGYIPQKKQLSTTLIGVRTNQINDEWSGTYTFESEFIDGWMVSTVRLTKIDGGIVLAGINVIKTSDSQKELNKFANAEISIIKVMSILITFVVPIIMVITCISVFRTPINKKWRWYLASFIGIGGFSLNWSTGMFYYKLATIKLLGFGAYSQGEYAPFIFTFTLPVGAALYWYKRSTLIAKAQEASLPEQNSTP